MIVEQIDRLKEAAAELDWTASTLTSHTAEGAEIYCVDFEAYSPAGEDFIFSVWGENAEEIVQEVCEYADNFDETEHVIQWIGGSGAPDALTLAIDAKKIHVMLFELATRLLKELRKINKEAANE